jgi:hypothetical protein
MQWLPFPILESDVTDVIYLTWMIDVQAAQAYLPAYVPLWQRDGKTPFTILTYRHGHFGPAFLGRLRRWMPSPLQSNWRLYAEEEGQIIFLKNILSSAPHALATRLLSDVLQSHYPAQFRHEPEGEVFRTQIDGGNGSAPALRSDVRITQARNAPPQFANWSEAVQFLACQHTALANVARNGRLAISEIDLPIDASQVLPLSTVGEVHCPLLTELQAGGTPFCFLVPAVKFRALSEYSSQKHE